VKQILSEKLPNVPGKTLTVVEVDYCPGGISAPHRHRALEDCHQLLGHDATADSLLEGTIQSRQPDRWTRDWSATPPSL